MQLIGLRDDAPEVQALHAKLTHSGGPGLPFEDPTWRYAVFANGVAVGVPSPRGWYFRAYLRAARGQPADHADAFPVPAGLLLDEDTRNMAFSRAKFGAQYWRNPVIVRVPNDGGSVPMAAVVHLDFQRQLNPTTGSVLWVRTALDPGQTMILWVSVPAEARDQVRIQGRNNVITSHYDDVTEVVWAPGSDYALVTGSHTNLDGVRAERSFGIDLGTYGGPMHYVLQVVK